MKVYLCAIIGAFILCAYFTGRHIGYTKCQHDIINTSTSVQTNTIKQMEKINAETNHSTLHDIRNILRAQYTIGE